MNRLTAAIRLDLLSQQRYGFFYAAGFVSLVWIVLLRQLPAWMLDMAIPAVIFLDLGIVGFYFIAGMVLFEKGEATLLALVVSPLRFWEYLAAKLVTLTLLAIVISLVVTIATYGLGFNGLLLVLGVALTSLLTLLVGFIAVSPYRSISEFILPSQLYFLALNLPLVDYFGWQPSLLFYLIPSQGSLLLLRSAFEPAATWQLVYAILYQLIWVGVLLWLARRAFDRHILAREGGR